MLAKNRRISRKEFPYILSKGKKYDSNHLFLYMTPIHSNGANKSSKFSFSISKKVRPSAVERNKYRRRGYSIVSNHIEEVKPGYFYFFSFKKGSVPMKFSVLEKEITELLSVPRMIK